MRPITPYHRFLSRLSRRELMRLAWYVGAAAIVQPVTTTRTSAQMLFTDYPFPLGVASGDPTPTGVVLWTRLAPRPLEGGGMPMTNVEVAWEIAGDPAFDAIVLKGTTIAFPELAHSVHVEADGLLPGRDYWYRFRVGREVSQVGRTKTAPASGANVDSLRFAVCGCSHYEDGFFTAYRHLANESFDFVFHTGDYIYEGRANAGRNERAREHVGQELYGIEQYRARFAQYKMDDDLRAAHRSAPFIMSWDDHEVKNNYAGDKEGNTPSDVFLLRRAAAYQAYYEHMPLRAAAMPRGNQMILYRRLAFGSLVDLSVLDTRQYRSDQACGDGEKSDCPASLDPTRTMLGPDQERWLFDNLARARARWTVVGQQVYSFARDSVKVNPEGRFSMDAWDGYASARRRLYDRLQETGAPNPVVISGDFHEAYGADLKLDFQNPRSHTVGVELTNSSISAGGDGRDVGDTWDRIKPDNPHIKLHNARRGYIACAVTPAALRAEFRTLDRVTTPGAPVKTAGALVVEAGRPGFQA